jgi:hypothetical protein
MSKPAILSVHKQISAATGIAQDNVIFAMILFAFVVWITTKGELGTYLRRGCREYSIFIAKR